MGLLRKFVIGKTAVDFVGKKVRKAEKKAKKSVKRAKKTVLFAALGFCAGAACTAYFAYTHRAAIADAVNGIQLQKRGHFIRKIFLRKLKK